MPETHVFRCQCCGQIAPRDRLETEGPFPLESFLQSYGGKVKLSDEEKELRKGGGFRQGSGRGRIDYEPLEVDDELVNLFTIRLQQILDSGIK